MISEFSARAKAKNNNAKILFFSLLGVAAVVTVFYLTAERYRGVIGVIALCFITAAIFVYTKYISSVYFYDITFDYNNSPVFVVRQRTGKKDTTLCRMDLYAVTDVIRQDKKERAEHKTKDGYLKYNYTPTLSPDETYLIRVFSRYEKAEIRIEATEEFAALLKQYAAEAKELRALAEAEEEF